MCCEDERIQCSTYIQSLGLKSEDDCGDAYLI